MKTQDLLSPAVEATSPGTYTFSYVLVMEALRLLVFTDSAQLGRVSHRVRMSVCLSAPTSAPTSEINVEASEEFKCDMCGVVYKKEATLRKYINTKHQLDPEEVDTIIQNDSNEIDQTLSILLGIQFSQRNGQIKDGKQIFFLNIFGLV